MKSTPTPRTHTARTKAEVTTTVGPSKYEVTVPAGTRCAKLDGGSEPWVVDDLSFIENKQGILYSDADIYGIRIEEANLADITPIAR
ncbi:MULTISPECIES: hypothetical protein [unclassified Variovorax]|uniref:hypothetical protein n=1 Tax=unclassified Variovorax TaxID=663243 RepID=UPI00083824A0|nr:MULTISPECIES: hypothetical protein [unclassified Variovorax]PNG50150.1 hypothetical protein CHC06_05773 [Variovorax sp. B2]PNG51023.1 hypothetical protein CHC07_05679 [Variovorax sp. B4]VTV17191.1 hypothetical protein WDL1P1_00189 [Variovorax sp. WDL1]